MAKSGPAKYTAAAPMTGYLYQARYALLLLLRRVRSGQHVRMSVEKFDDVAFEAGGAPRELVQTKHHCKPGNLTDLGEDLWKTLRVWCEGVRDKHFLVPGVIFSLVTTQEALPDSAAALLRPGPAGRDPARAEQLLVAAAKASANQQIAPACGVFLGLPAQKRRDMLADVHVFDAAARAGDLDAPLRAELRLAAPRGREAGFLAGVEGWWFRRLIRHLEAADMPAVRGGELEAEVERLRDEYRDDALPIERPLPDPPGPPDPSDPREFVRRLREVGIADRRVRQAILDFYRATVHRDRWFNEELLHAEELADYDARLVGEWDRACDAVLEGLAGTGKDERAAAGRRLFLKLDEDAAHYPVFFIRPRCVEACISRGTLHGLADAGRLAWHPDGAEAARAAGGMIG